VWWTVGALLIMPAKLGMTDMIYMSVLRSGSGW
jgi:hypothetical protein